MECQPRVWTLPLLTVVVCLADLDIGFFDAPENKVGSILSALERHAYPWGSEISIHEKPTEGPNGTTGWLIYLSFFREDHTTESRRFLSQKSTTTTTTIWPVAWKQGKNWKLILYKKWSAKHSQTDRDESTSFRSSVVFFFLRPPPGWLVVDHHMEKSHSPLKGSKRVNLADVKSQIQVGAWRFSPKN